MRSPFIRTFQSSKGDFFMGKSLQIRAFQPVYQYLIFETYNPRRNRAAPQKARFACAESCTEGFFPINWHTIGQIVFFNETPYSAIFLIRICVRAVNRGSIKHARLFPSVLFGEQFPIRFAPRNHGIENGQQRPAQLRDGVFRARRQFGIDGFGYETVVHQLLQLQVEHARCGFGQRLVQPARAHGRTAQLIQDAGLPFGVDQAHRQPQRAAQIDGYLSFVHNRLFYGDKDTDNIPNERYTE